MLQSVIDTNQITILGIPPYYFMAGLGLLFAFSLFLFLTAQEGLPVNREGLIVMASLVGLFAGARLFGCFARILVLTGRGEPLTLRAVQDAGIVFYGGLTGFLCVFAALQKRLFGVLRLRIFNIAAPAIPLFHLFARIGCFLSGCCYGKETALPWLGIPYVIRGQTEIVNRIPVQLMEAGVNGVLFIILLKKRRRHPEENLMLQYLAGYAVCRFFLEFFRGDEARGFLGFLSFSQIYSILLILTIILVKYGRKRQ